MLQIVDWVPVQSLSLQKSPINRYQQKQLKQTALRKVPSQLGNPTIPLYEQTARTLWISLGRAPLVRGAVTGGFHAIVAVLCAHAAREFSPTSSTCFGGSVREPGKVYKFQLLGKTWYMVLRLKLTGQFLDKFGHHSAGQSFFLTAGGYAGARSVLS